MDLKRAKKKHDLYKKSKYYQESRKRLFFLGGFLIVGILVLILLLVLLFTGGDKNAKPAASSQTQKEADQAEASSGEAEETKANATLPAEPVTLTVSLTGDCTLGTDENFDYGSSLNAYYESNGSAYFFQNVKSLFQADDLTIVNMEGTLTDSDSREDKQFAFKAEASYADILTQGSVEAANLANNHSHDYGEGSYEDTKAALDAAGIVHFGYEDTAVLDIKGVKVGLVGIYELADHMERADQVKENISRVKAEGAQLVIVVFHWGNETETIPDSNQTALGRLAIDEGADLVVGHHPHVLQGVEKYKGKFIAYSLGNFCFGGNSGPSDMDTMIFQQTFTIDENGVAQDDAINLIPCSISSVYDYNNYQPTPAEGEEAARILSKIQERSAAISDSMDFYFQEAGQGE